MFSYSAPFSGILYPAFALWLGLVCYARVTLRSLTQPIRPLAPGDVTRTSYRQVNGRIWAPGGRLASHRTRAQGATVSYLSDDFLVLIVEDI